VGCSSGSLSGSRESTGSLELSNPPADSAGDRLWRLQSCHGGISRPPFLSISVSTSHAPRVSPPKNRNHFLSSMASSSNFNFSALSLVFLLAVHACAQTCLPPPTIELTFGRCSFIYNDAEINSYGILVGVGNSSNPENICVMPSTVVNSTMLQSSEICDSDQLDNMTRAQCLSRRGGVVTRDALPSAPTDSLPGLNPGWVSLMSIDTTVPWQYAVQAAVQLRDQTVTMIEGLITQGQQHTASHLGLAESSPLLQSLKDAGLIGARSWGLNAGSQSYSAPRVGSLVLGGYDEESIEGNFFSYDIPVPNPPLNNRPCPLKVKIVNMTLTVQNVSNSMVGPANSLTACVEPYVSQW